MRIFPGFMMPLGSRAPLMDLMTAMPVGPNCASRCARLPTPMPCSPVQVPPRAMALLARRDAVALHAAYSSGFSGSKRRAQWKLPSPTCPNIGPN